MSLVIDTDVVSLIFKGDSRGEKYLQYLESSELLISFMSEAELERWFLQARWGSDRVTRFRGFMRRFTSVGSSGDLILKWAEVMVEARGRGRRIETADAWIAATALLYDAILITNNPSDYAGVSSLKIASPIGR